MPLYGVIPDSPWIYGAQKFARSFKKAGRSAPRPPAVQRFSFSVTNVIIYREALRLELNTPKGGLWRYMENLGDDIVRGARTQVGVKTGALRASIHKRHLSNVTGQYVWVGSQKSYAYLHHEGTRPHVIRPNDEGGILVFGKGGRIIKTRQVNHPGTKPNRYLSGPMRTAMMVRN